MSTERRPTLCIVAGPNGSGKTTLILTKKKKTSMVADDAMIFGEKQ